MFQSHVLVFILLIFAVAVCDFFVLNNDCPKDFEMIGSKCYFVEKEERVTWDDANQHCESRGAELLSIESAAEMNLINSYLEDNGFTQSEHTDGFWTSGNDLEKEGEFYWRATGEQITYAHWYPYGDPNNWGGNENCVQLWYQDTWYMNDLACSFHNKYICEFEETSEVNDLVYVRPLGFWAIVGRFFAKIIHAIIDFFANIFSLFG